MFLPGFEEDKMYSIQGGGLEHFPGSFALCIVVNPRYHALLTQNVWEHRFGKPMMYWKSIIIAGSSTASETPSNVVESTSRREAI